MNEDRDQDRFTKPPAGDKRRPEWRQDLTPNHLSRQKVGQVSDARVNAEWTAYHRRKRGRDLSGLNAELEQAPTGKGDDATVDRPGARRGQAALLRPPRERRG